MNEWISVYLSDAWKRLDKQVSSTPSIGFASRTDCSSPHKGRGSAAQSEGCVQHAAYALSVCPLRLIADVSSPTSHVRLRAGRARRLRVLHPVHRCDFHLARPRHIPADWDPFAEDEWRGFEYAHDIEFWYIFSFGQPSQAALGLGWVQVGFISNPRGCRS